MGARSVAQAAERWVHRQAGQWKPKSTARQVSQFGVGAVATTLTWLSQRSKNTPSGAAKA